MSRIFSGIQPTGDLQLGNYLGALKNWVMLQHNHDCIYCVVDLHAITMWQDPKVLAPNTREVTAGLIASGLDPDKNIIFNELYVDWDSDLVITEGIFDAIKAGPNSIPLLGSTVRENSKLFQKIIKFDLSTLDHVLRIADTCCNYFLCSLYTGESIGNN